MSPTTTPDYLNTEALSHRYVIGIDLGTTNSAVAYVDLLEAEAGATQRAIHTLPIPQLVAAGNLASRSMLPSFLYLPGGYDLGVGATSLPWDPERPYVVGEFAREQGARVPGRLVASAKSWLCHAGVDRAAPILPWGAPVEVAKVSPVTASMRYLQHIREVWNATQANAEDETTWFEEQILILTVPASFDEVARELTLTAAREAGYKRVILLEEPLAAFYAWLSANETTWQQRMRDSQLILVCDVGGGTTDFSLIGIRQGGSGLRFDRLAVGNHLLLGGDNMDLALARHLETKLMGQPGKLDAQRWHQLVYHCRKAKETLLNQRERREAVDITLMGAAGKLIGGVLKGTLNQEEVQQLILEGFFPEVAATAQPAERRRSGLTELGLPYVQDAAITRHLAAFWQRFIPYLQQETGRQTPFPDFVLFNGGALIPATLRHRLRSVIRHWFQPVAGPDWAPAELDNPHPELAVALGAAYYGLVRQGKGVRVGSGSPRAYYVGVEMEQASLEQRVANAVCLTPRGVEEGFQAQLQEPKFVALTNQPVTFQIYTSSTRIGDHLGDVVQLPPEEVTPLPPIRTVLRYGRRGSAQQLPVQLAVRLTEIGTLELWCQAQQSEHRWQLQFDVRQSAEPVSAEPQVVVTVDQALVDAAKSVISRTFHPPAGETPLPPEGIRRTLEETLGLAKERWPTAIIRTLADVCLENGDGRAKSAEHEVRWLNLAGFCLRPGFGDPLDEWRMKQAWKLFFQELHFPRQAQSRTEWWIFWRRVAGGLKAGQQVQFYQQVRSYLDDAGRRKRKPSALFPKSLTPAEELEIWLALANFEWLPSETKTELGRQLLNNIRKSPPKPQALWALSHFGARTTIYGPLDRLIPSSEAAVWAKALMTAKLERSDSLAHALIVLTRSTGDRARDVPEEVRNEVATWLSQLPKGKQFQDLLLNAASATQQEEQEWLFGETLPAGLVLA